MLFTPKLFTAVGTNFYMESLILRLRIKITTLNLQFLHSIYRVRTQVEMAYPDLSDVNSFAAVCLDTRINFSSAS